MFSCFRLPGGMKVWIDIRSVWMIAFLLCAGKVVLVCPMCEGLGVEKLVIILPLLNRNRNLNCQTLIKLC